LRGDTKEPSWTQDRQIRTEHWTLRHNTVERGSTKQEQRRKFQFGNLTATGRGPRPAACKYGTSHGHDKNSSSQMHFTCTASSEPLLRDEITTGLLLTHLRVLPLHLRYQINIYFVLSRLHYIAINIIDKTVWYTYITITTPLTSAIDPLWFTSSSETIPSNTLKQRCPISLKKY